MIYNRKKINKSRTTLTNTVIIGSMIKIAIARNNDTTASVKKPNIWENTVNAAFTFTEIFCMISLKSVPKKYSYGRFRYVRRRRLCTANLLSCTNLNCIWYSARRKRPLMMNTAANPARTAKINVLSVWIPPISHIVRMIGFCSITPGCVTIRTKGTTIDTPKVSRNAPIYACQIILNPIGYIADPSLELYLPWRKIEIIGCDLHRTARIIFCDTRCLLPGCPPSLQPVQQLEYHPSRQYPGRKTDHIIQDILFIIFLTPVQSSAGVKFQDML